MHVTFVQKMKVSKDVMATCVFHVFMNQSSIETLKFAFPHNLKLAHMLMSPAQRAMKIHTCKTKSHLLSLSLSLIFSLSLTHTRNRNV